MKNVTIVIKSLQHHAGGDDDAIELFTDGLFSYEDGKATFSYMESELTGLDGTKTTFDISPMSVVMTREGSMNSRMIFEEGRKHNFLYDTPFGATTMGVRTNKVSVNLDEHGGNMEVDYLLDYQYSVIGRNHFMIKVREQKEEA